METPYTDDNRISEISTDVQQYLEWISRTDAELRTWERETPLHLKPVNRRVVDVPVF